MRRTLWRVALAGAACAALAVPLQAGALEEGGEPSASKLTVSASLGICGVSGGGIACRIDASWSGIEGAHSYTASVTLPGGGVHEAGAVGSGPDAGAGPIWIPYAGAGTYTVSITAWGAGQRAAGDELGQEQAGAALGE